MTRMAPGVSVGVRVSAVYVLKAAPSIALPEPRRPITVVQTALYGYLRTRTGSLYPELFSNDAFMISVNNAN
jgi:hypothetical protein